MINRQIRQVREKETVFFPLSRIWRFSRSKLFQASHPVLSACSAGKVPARVRAQQGVALVITLILLSVITFMAVTFLVVSRRESEQVNTLSQQNNAKYAASIAADYAQSQIFAQMLAQSNGYGFGLQVSTNFNNPFYYSALDPFSVTNVGYNDPTTGNLLSGNLMAQMQNNLLVLPRAPVFITTNKTQTTPEFRFYLDLNRNGRYDTNGLVTLIGDDNRPIKDSGGNPIINFMTGDPEWVGILDHPDQRHSSSNFFIGRYAFIALPIGNTLDINFIHNEAKQSQIAPNFDSFLRNQGVGSWEINLAGFLNGLNANSWPSLSYDYNTNLGSLSQGAAFFDAAEILQFRYKNNFANLRSFNTLYLPNNPLAPVLYANDFIDGYSRGPLMTDFQPLANDFDQVALPWSGDANPSQFFTTQDLFSSAQVLNSFSNNLYSVGLLNSTYNRYTFYRMLSQIGVESAPEPYPYPYITKLNLNYSNVVAGNATASIPSTNFQAWSPVQFFTNALIRMLRSRSEFTQTNVNLCANNAVFIPVYPTNFYTPSVHRMLQLAANIYDANTNRAFKDNPTNYFPSVFRPIFLKTVTNSLTNIAIIGYSEVAKNIDFTAPADLRRYPDLVSFPLNIPWATNVYGIPYVIGAKQGLPNFNSFTMVPVVQVSRKIELVKHPGGGLPYQTNISYEIGISNVFGASCWNSYFSNYNRGVVVYATNEMTMALWLTNDINLASPSVTNVIVTSISGFANPTSPFLPNTWTGRPANLFNPATPVAPSFRRILLSGTNFLNNVYVQRFPLGLTVNGPLDGQYPQTPRNYIPGWSLTITNRLRVIVQDQSTGRLIDYVLLGGSAQMNGLDSFEDINGDLQSITFNPNDATGLLADPNTGSYSLWTTNAARININTPRGIWNQIAISQRSNAVPNVMWGSLQNSVASAVVNFNNWIGANTTILTYPVPFVATAKYTNTFTWSANDPLVHYFASDLNDLTSYSVSSNLVSSFYTNTVGTVSSDATNSAMTPANLATNVLRVSNFRYQPWGNTGNPKLSSIGTNELAYKDPLIANSDAWQFPTNRFPNIGWLGRVHRGTPWQTVYLKSSTVNPGTWQNWTGNSLTNYYGLFNDAAISQPINDWKLLDLFTTAPNENASRGQLSINQSGTAAWAAVLDGVITVTNTSSTSFAPFVISPTNFVNVGGAFTNTIEYIVSAINAQRQTNYPGGVFTSVGDILSVPQLTVASPFLNTNNIANLSDAAYERIPQQILSLLRVGTPRYVIYAYGQSLKPADRSIVTGGPFFGMCTNYQITGEVVTRTVVRFEPVNPATLGFLPAGPMKPVVESFTVLPPE